MSRDKRTFPERSASSRFDPERTSGFADRTSYGSGKSGSVASEFFCSVKSRKRSQSLETTRCDARDRNRQANKKAPDEAGAFEFQDRWSVLCNDRATPTVVDAGGDHIDVLTDPLGPREGIRLDGLVSAIKLGLYRLDTVCFQAIAQRLAGAG